MRETTRGNTGSGHGRWHLPVLVGSRGEIWRPGWVLPALLMLLVLPGRAMGDVIHVGPQDGWEPIEAAQAGDEVLLAPGTYQFRLYLDKQGTETQPIVIRAEDPANPPRWDLDGQPVGDWPGSYGAGDKGRGAWQITGSYYEISGIQFLNCQDSSSSGIRILGGSHITIRDCLFRGNTNGLIGSGEDVVVEFCEFDGNGKTSSSGNMTHNIYIYGGTFTLRYSYLHDPREGQDFHIRARHAVLEYNWITRPASYLGDVMTCESLCGGSDSDPIEQVMELRGNVLIQGQPANMSQIIALFDDEDGPSNDGTGQVETMRLVLVNNTIIGTPRDPGQTHRLVNMRNDSVNTYAEFYNNIIVDIAALAEARDPNLDNWGVTGEKNWVTQGTDVGDLTDVIQGGDPGFMGPAGLDFTLQADSPCLGQAAQDAPGLPEWEYYKDEQTTRMRRPRATAEDLGAFEQGNAAEPEGPYGTNGGGGDAGLGSDGGPGRDGGTFGDAYMTFDGGPQSSDGAAPDGGSSSGSGKSGCGCRGAGGGPGGPFLVLLVLFGLFVQRFFNG